MLNITNAQPAPNCLGCGLSSSPVNHAMGLCSAQPELVRVTSLALAWLCEFRPGCAQAHKPLGSQDMTCMEAQSQLGHTGRQPSSPCRFYRRRWRHDPVYYHFPGEDGGYTQLHCQIFPSATVLVASIEIGFLMSHPVPSQTNVLLNHNLALLTEPYFNRNCLLKISTVHLPSLFPPKCTWVEILFLRGSQDFTKHEIRIWLV